MALDADLLDHFLVEVVEQLFARVLLAFGNLGFQLFLELVELKLNLLRRAALLIDGGDALFEIDARLDRAEHFVACAEHAIEEPEFLVEQLIDALIRRVLLVQEIDHDHVELLAVAMASADALLDTLRIPWQIVVHDEVAELQVDALRCRFGRDQDGGLVSEVIDQRCAQVCRWGAGDAVCAGVFR